MARAEAFTAARADRPEALDRLIAIAGDDRQGPLVQANAAGYLGRYSDPRATTALLAAAKAIHPAIRSAAISSLGRQPTSAMADARPVILAALSDPQRAVRISAIVSLINRGGEPLGPGDAARFRFVGAEFAARARLHEDDASIQRDLGLVQLLSDRFDLAADALQISVGLGPDQPSVKFLLALARLGQRRTDEARALLKQVQPADPYYKLAQERLKQLDPPR
jgi:tetratricopeptide (TPR) repeat protein